MVAFIDVEHALDPHYARACGVNVDELLVSQPDTGEQALEITETLIRSGGIDCVVLDSVAALVPRAEIEGEMGDSFVGIQARLMSQALRKLTGAVSRSNTALVFTNQLREKIGVMFGNPETTPGGRALKFYASVRLDIRRIETIKTGTESIGSRVRVKVVKNKVAAPFRVAEFDVMYGEGISREGGLLDVGVASGIVDQDRRLVHLRRDAPRPGSRAGQGVPARQPGRRAAAGERDPRARSPRSRSRSRASPRRSSGHRPVHAAPRASATVGRAHRPRSASARAPRSTTPTSSWRRRPRSSRCGHARWRRRGGGCAASATRSRSSESVLARLGELGYLDDEAFARAWVESRDRARPRGEVALRRELGLQGRGPRDHRVASSDERDARSAPGQPGRAPTAGRRRSGRRRPPARAAAREPRSASRTRGAGGNGLRAARPQRVRPRRHAPRPLASPGRRGAIHAEHAPRLTLRGDAGRLPPGTARRSRTSNGRVARPAAR